MSREVAKEIIRRTKEDKSFLESLIKNPGEALKGYQLTPKEKEFFIKADRKTIEGLSPSCFELTKGK